MGGIKAQVNKLTVDVRCLLTDTLCEDPRTKMYARC